MDPIFIETSKNWKKSLLSPISTGNDAMNMKILQTSLVAFSFYVPHSMTSHPSELR